ncbi:MAG: hypothetical protein HQ507_06805 [Candidatus Marinimicrobia bacterium]|nr:hypothetical protein [Candidatus Neomarinimicrobiota bacterium]
MNRFWSTESPARYAHQAFYESSRQVKRELTDVIVEGFQNGHLERPPVFNCKGVRFQVLGSWLALRAKRWQGESHREGFVLAADWFPGTAHQNSRLPLLHPLVFNATPDCKPAAGDKALANRVGLRALFHAGMGTGRLLLELNALGYTKDQDTPFSLQRELFEKLDLQSFQMPNCSDCPDVTINDMQRKLVGEEKAVIRELCRFNGTEHCEIRALQLRAENLRARGYPLCDPLVAVLKSLEERSMLPPWDNDIDAHISANEVVDIPLNACIGEHAFKVVLRQKNGEALLPGCEEIEKAIHARDVTLNEGRCTLIFPWALSRLTNGVGTDPMPTVALLSNIEEEYSGHGKLVAGFYSDVDFAARTVIEGASLMLPDQETAMLLLMPIRDVDTTQSTGKRNPENAAVLAFILGVPKSFAASLADPRENYENTFTETLRQRIAIPLEKKFGFRYALQALRNSYFSRSESIHSYAIGRLEDRLMREEIPVGQANGDTPTLARLLDLQQEAAFSSTMEPLDAICHDIAGSMVELLTGIQWGVLAGPLEQFASQERLLLGPDDHRDHYFHTWKTFLLGRKLLIALGVYDEFVRRRWILASLLHDSCYPIQEAEVWLGDYMKKFQPTGLKGSIETVQLLDQWRGQGYLSCWFDALLRIVDTRLTNWLTNGSTGNRLQSTALFGLLRERNHAVLGALSLLRNGMKMIGLSKPNSTRLRWMLRKDRNMSVSKEGVPSERTRSSELIDAATCILLHDPGVWQAVKGTTRFKRIQRPRNLNEIGSRRETAVSLIAWTLGLVDAIQEWGRDINLDREEDGDLHAGWWMPTSFDCQTSGVRPLKLNLTVKYGPNFKNGVRKVQEDAEDFLKKLATRAERDGYKILLNRDSQTIEQQLDFCADVWVLCSGKFNSTTEIWCSVATEMVKRIERVSNTDAGTFEENIKELEYGEMVDLSKRIKLWVDDANAQNFDRWEDVLKKSLRRLHGFRTVPWQAIDFWNAPTNTSVEYIQMCDGTPIGPPTNSRI